MSKEKLVPRLRFEEFLGNKSWSKKELNEVALYRNGKAHENDIADEGSFIVVNSKFVSTNGSVKKYTNNQNEPLFKDEIAFVLSDVPNGRAIARTYLITKNNKYTLNQRIAGITPNQNTNSYFLYNLMNRNPYFLKFDDGVKQTNLSKADVNNFYSFYPIKEEQNKIGCFLKKIDEMIQLQKSKVNKVKDIKSAYLSEMFPKKGEKYPKKRFGGFIKPWKKYKLTDIATFLKGRGLARKDMVENGQYECILYGHLYTVYGMVIDNIIYKTNTINQNMITSQKGDVLIPSSDTTPTGLARASSLEKDDIILGGDINILRPNRNIDGSFLSYNINANRSQLLKLIKGTTVKHIYNDDLKDVLVRVPEKEEQKLIVDLFRNIDNQIAIEEEKLAKLEKLKQAYLNDMFV